MTFEYSEKVMKNFLKPKNIGEIKNPDGVGEVGNAACGDIMHMEIKVEKDIIKDVKFKTFGCAAAIASTSMITQLVKGKSLEYAEKLSMKDVAEELKGLPQIKMHCSTMGIETLKECIKDYKKEKEEKMIPKVKFYIHKPGECSGSINHFLNWSDKKENWDWSQIIFKKYPELRKKLDKEKIKSKKQKILEEFFKNHFEKNKNLIEKNRKEFQKEWNKINEKCMEALSKVLEIKWPKKDKEIYAVLSLNPICPRWIKERSFDIHFDFTTEMMKAVAIHEILHFLYFEKWKQVFPKADEKEFDHPHLVWKLSEMVPKAILSDEKIQKVFKHKPLVYDEWKFAKINGKPLLSQIGKFYYEKRDFEDFLRKSWTFIQKHEKEINQI